MRTDYSAENSAFSNLGQTLGSLPGDIKKQAEADAKKAAYAAAAKSGDLTSLGRALILNGDAQSGAAILSLSQKDALNKSVMEGIKGWSSSPSSPQVSLGSPNEVENRFIGEVQKAGLTNPVGLGAVAAYGKSESGWSPENVNKTWSDPSESGAAGTSGGTMSWRAERLQNLQNFARQRGEQGNGSPETQAAFLASEDPTLIPRLNAAKSPQEANQIMANAWRFAGYDRPGQGEYARREGLTTQYAQRYGAQPGAAPAQQPVQVAENEADVRRLEQEQAAAPDSRAPGAANAQGFFIPPGPQPQVDAIANDPQVKLWRERLSSPLAIQSEAARGIAQKNLDIATKDAERRLGQTEAVKNYRFYLEEERAAGRQPMSFQDFRKSTAPQTKIEMPPAEKEYDKQSAKDFAELNRDVAKRASTANGKIATLNRLETLLSDPNVRQGAGAQAALQAARIAKGVFGIDTEGLGPAEAVNAISNQFALELRNPSGGAGMPGALSDKDREFLQSLTPGLERTPEGNKLIIDYMKRLAKRDVEIEGLRRDYIKQNKRLDDGFYDKLSEFSEKNPLFPEAAKAAPANAEPRRVSNPDEVKGLPSGTLFIDPNGVTRRVP